jgi:hypothetical protein
LTAAFPRNTSIVVPVKIKLFMNSQWFFTFKSYNFPNRIFSLNHAVFPKIWTYTNFFSSQIENSDNYSLNQDSKGLFQNKREKTTTTKQQTSLHYKKENWHDKNKSLYNEENWGDKIKHRRKKWHKILEMLSNNSDHYNVLTNYVYWIVLE